MRTMVCAECLNQTLRAIEMIFLPQTSLAFDFTLGDPASVLTEQSSPLPCFLPSQTASCDLQDAPYSICFILFAEPCFHIQGSSFFAQCFGIKYSAGLRCWNTKRYGEWGNNQQCMCRIKIWVLSHYCPVPLLYQWR